MLKVSQLTGFGGGEAPKLPVDIVYTDNTSSNSNLSSYTFNSRSIGVADASRIVIVGVAARSGSTFNVTGVTIGGNAATLITRTTGNDDAAAIYALAVPAGTTANIVVTTSAAAVRLGIGVWAMYNKTSVAAHATNSVNNGSGTISAAAPADGCAVAVFFDDTGTSKSTSGHTQMTNDFNVLITDNNNGRYYGASGDGTTASNATFSIAAATDNAGSIATWASEL